MPSIYRSMCAALAACFFLLLPARAQSSLPEIAPGITLPGNATVVALDQVNGQPARVTIHATEIKSNSHAGSNFARSMVYAGPKSGIELPGQHAAVTLQSATPVFYVRLSTDDPETQRNRITLLSLKPLKDSREVIQFSANVFGGSRKRHVDDLPVTKEDVADGTWVKITPKEKLQPGEYGLVSLPKDDMLFTAVVYDFTVAAAK